jgi:hypothetical protein
VRSLGTLAGMLTLAVAGLGAPELASAQNVSIGVQTTNMQLGVNLGPAPPPLVVIPAPVIAVPAGPPPPAVYYAPNLPYNYFVYRKAHYLFHDGRWFRSGRYDGPWTSIAIAQVPRPILAVPVEHYHVRPAHWKQHGPPPWAHDRQRERGWEQGRGRGHGQHGEGHDRGHGKDRG